MRFAWQPRKQRRDRLGGRMRVRGRNLVSLSILSRNVAMGPKKNGGQPRKRGQDFCVEPNVRERRKIQRGTRSLCLGLQGRRKKRIGMKKERGWRTDSAREGTHAKRRKGRGIKKTLEGDAGSTPQRQRSKGKGGRGKKAHTARRGGRAPTHLTRALKGV